MNKICSKCGQTLDLSLFNKDRKNRDGHASSCRDCKNAARRLPKNLSPTESKKVFMHGEKINQILIEERIPVKTKFPLILSLEDLISELLLKHQSFLNFTVNRKGNATLQIFASDMKRTYKGDTVEKLVELVGREEGL